MGEHPSSKALEAFLLGELGAREAKAVVIHLLGGCLRCQSLMAPLARAMFRPGRAEEDREREKEYDGVLAAASAAVLERHRQLVHERAESESKVARLLYGVPPVDPEFWTLAVCETLLEKILGLRHRDPKGMLHLARLATEAAQRLNPGRYGALHVSDVRAQAWAELANAYRVTDQFRLAEAAIQRALEFYREGTESPLLRARLAELSASLFCDQRQFPTAFRLLDFAHKLFKKHGELHAAGRVLITKGLHTGYTGDPEEGIRMLARGLRLIQRDRDPKLVFQVLHNLLLFRVELGEYRVARHQLWEMRPLYRHYSDRIALIKLRWIEGKIFIGLGKLKHAERAFGQARQDFEREGLKYDAALVSFDLGGLWLLQGRKADAHRLVNEMLETFRSRYIAREAIAALLMLREAVNRDEASADLFEVVATLFKGLRDNSTEKES